MAWCVYILKCSDATLYTGITNDIDSRIAKHEAGLGAKYTKGRGPFHVVYKEECHDRSEASRREIQIKSLSRSEKESLISQT